MKILRILLTFCFLPGFANVSLAQNGNQPYIRFTLFTGGDDLRNGQNVTVSLFPNPNMGQYPEFRDVNMNQGRGSASNTTFSYVFPLGNGWTPNSFKAFKILHDGSGHNAFEGYDNWNLDRIRVVFVDPNATPRQTVLLDLSGQPLVRFTGDKRGQSWNFMPQNAQNGNTASTANTREKQPMSDWTVGQIKMSQYNTVDDPLQTMIVKINQAGSFQTMSTVQARRIVESYRDDVGRIKLAQACFTLVRDKDQFGSLVDLLGSPAAVRQFGTLFGQVTNTAPVQPSAASATGNSNTNNRVAQTRVAEGTVKGTYIRIRYGSLSIRGRDVWSSISPYGKLWRTGINEATTITFDRDVIIGKSDAVPAGTYSLFTIPGSPNWTFVLNKNNRLWGTQGYSQDDDVARYSEDARPHAYTDQLTFEVISDGIMLRWENVEVFMYIR